MAIRTLTLVVAPAFAPAAGAVKQSQRLVRLIPPGPCREVRPLTLHAPLPSGGSLTVETCPAGRD